MQVSPEQKAAWDKSLNNFGVAILDKVKPELNATVQKVNAFVETEASERVAADNEILSQVQIVKDLQEGKANAFVYFADEQEVNGRDVTEILRDNGKTNFSDVTYIIKNTGEKEQTIVANVNDEKREYALGNQDGLAVSFDKKGKLIVAVPDNNTFDLKLSNVQQEVAANYATNTDVQDLASHLTNSINNAIAGVLAYQF